MRVNKYKGGSTRAERARDCAGRAPDGPKHSAIQRQQSATAKRQQSLQRNSWQPPPPRSSSKAGLVFTARWLFVQMLDRREKDPFSDRELGGQNGQLAQCHWMRIYINHSLRDHAAIFEPPREHAGSVEPSGAAASAGLDKASRRESLWAQARRCVSDPVALRSQLIGSPTWLPSLPNQPLRLVLAHVGELFRNQYAAELKGALTQFSNPALYTPAKLRAGERARQRFAEDFEKAVKAYRLESGLENSAPKEVEGDNGEGSNGGGDAQGRGQRQDNGCCLS